MDENLPVPLDPIQLRKIESIHRGFLYQHLYAVGCLLLAKSNATTLIRVERDEDVEVCFSEAVVYIQVKTRTPKLYSDDISETLERFNEIRCLHKNGERAGNASFLIISNVPVGGTLADQYKQDEWPSDVDIVFPGASSNLDFELPPAWETLDAAIAWCVEGAEALPFRLLNSQTLVWKLAAVVQLACTGQGSQSHTFRTDILHELFEQVIFQLQSFPPEPSIYREHIDEPAYFSASSVRLIVGHSGAGKSVWASRLATHSPDSAVYFDVALVEEAAITSSLARELVAKLVTETGKRPHSLFLPGASGYETLAALNSYASENAFSPVVVIDNSHRISPEVLVRIKEVAAGFKWVFICQPSSNQVELATLLSLVPEHIQAWSLSSVAAEFEYGGCHLTPEEAQRVIELTGGVALFVRSIANVCKNDYAGNVEKTLQDIEGNLVLTTTAQEVIANRVYELLTDHARDAAAIMSLTPLPHPKEVLFDLISGLAGESGKESVPIRDLLSAGIAQVKAKGYIGLHDAFQKFCSRDLEALSPDKVQKALSRFRDIYSPPWDSSNINNIGPYFNALAGLSDYKSIIDICGSKAEFLYELGLTPVVKDLLYQAIEKTTEDEDLFYILDTLCFWNVQDGDEAEARRLLGEMNKILQLDRLTSREHFTFYIKRMQLDGPIKLEEAHKIYHAALKLSDDSLGVLILRYNYALILFKHKQYRQAAEESFNIAMEYYTRIGLDPDDVIAKNPPEIFEKLKDKEYDIDDFKRLADSFDLYAKCRVAQHQQYGVARLHAFKFYSMAYAIRSAIKVGMDVVDDYIGLLGDAIGARQFIEKTLLPGLSDFKVVEYFLPVRAQYAVVLAYCGDFTAARKEINQLTPFYESAPPEWVEEVKQQATLINAIEAGKIKMPAVPWQKNNIPQRPVRVEKRIGRNDPCPCRSGKKYKKCCGS